MPTDIIVVLVVVAIPVGIYAGTLYWTGLLKSGVQLGRPPSPRRFENPQSIRPDPIMNLGSRLVKFITQDRQRGRQRPGNFAPTSHFTHVSVDCPFPASSRTRFSPTPRRAQRTKQL
jgi:hypothetical protein